MQLNFKYLLSSFIVIVCCLQQYCLAETTTARPYKFGFTIEEQQHRYEKRDERGIVMGEFGFITADGIYHVTVYATDEQGRFRILAMKNYPYESPPKSVEVLVKPKITITATTTTQKPVLTRNNFNTEACSGCFLKNGKNKPKGLNGVDGTKVKTEIRPLSKVLPSSPKLTPNQPGLTQIPSQGTGKNFEPLNTSDLVATTFGPKENDLEINTTHGTRAIINNGLEYDKNTQSQEKSLKPHNIVTQQQHVKEQAPATLSIKHFDDIETNVASHYDIHKQLPATYVDENIIRDTTESVIQTKKTHNKEYLAIPTTTNRYTRSNGTRHTQTPTTVSRQNNVPTNLSSTLLKGPEGSFEYTATENTQTANTQTGNLSPEKSIIIENVLHTGSRIRHTQTPITVDKQQHTTPTLSKDTKYSSILLKSPQGNSVLTATANTQTGNTPPVMDTSISKVLPTLMEGNRMRHTQTPTTVEKQATKPISVNEKFIPTLMQGNKIRHTQTPTTVDKQQHTTPTLSNDTKFSSILLKSPQRNSVLTATANTQTGNTPPVMDTSISKVLPTLMEGNRMRHTQTPTTVEKQATKPTTFNEKFIPTLMQATSSPELTATPNTQTGSSPPIMDIIIEKVLPALMGNKGIPPTMKTTTNNKPNVTPSSNIPGTPKTFTPAVGNPGINSKNINKAVSNPSSVNGDGDLYRFKYILDHHGHTEIGNRNGNKEGNYFAIGDDDIERTIEYVANENGYQPHIRWRKLSKNESKPKENSLKDYEFIWFTQ